MQKTSERLELNSPAGDFECLKQAVYNGADYVYIGTKLFNARRLAKNFSSQELKDAIRFAHLHGVKILITQNTIVRNEEMDLWFKSLEEAYLAGADGVIIQEIFLAPIIRKFFPDLRIHASTQCSFMNHHGINALDFFDQVVLARELTYDEIKNIKKNIKVDLEIFVHGHLCIAYSGQCLISSLIGKRSGNRGVCASSCRKRYNDEGYLISAKDLMLANQLDKIAELGVRAIKIEGRMKSHEYVATATRYYRKQIDNIADKRKLNQHELEELKRGFNRDFTEGFFMDEKSIVGKSMPMNRGLYLGTVLNDKLKLQADLCMNDGISFWNKHDEGSKAKLNGFLLDKMTVDGIEKERARKGDMITIPSRYFRNGTDVFLTSRDIRTKPKFNDYILTVQGKKGKKVFISCQKEGITIESEIVLQEAKNQEISVKQVLYYLKKFTDDGMRFSIDEEKSDLDKELFLPNSMLKDMIEKLIEEIINKNIPKRESILDTGFLDEIKERIPNIRAEETRLMVKVYNIVQLKEANDMKQKETKQDNTIQENDKENKINPYAIYYDIFNKDVDEARKLCTNAKFFLDTPVILNDNDIEEIEKIIQRVKPDGIAIGNWGLLDVKFDGEKHGKYSLNVFNDITISELNKRGIIPMASVELNAKQISKLKDKQIIYYTHGQIPVMHFKGEYKERSLKDEKGYAFPLRIVNGNTEMLYSRPIAALEKIKPLINYGLRYFFLDLNRDTATIIRAYQNIIKGKKQDISMLKKGTTIGNYEKGVA